MEYGDISHDTVCASCGSKWAAHFGTKCPGGNNTTFYKREDPVKTLSVTDDRVKKAAESCLDAKRVLTELFPEVFAPQVQYVVPEAKTNTNIPLTLDGKRIVHSIQLRSGGEYLGKGFFLPKTMGIAPYNTIEWSVRKDLLGEFVLIGEVKS